MRPKPAVDDIDELHEATELS